MEGNNQTVAPVETDDDEPIHLPPPSWAPIILAMGLTLIAFGAVLSPIILIVGVVLFLIGLGSWISDEIKNASTADEHVEQHPSQGAA